MTKRRSPTTPKRRRSQVLLEADQQKLIQRFSILEREWQSFKSLKPRILCRPSTAVVKSLRLLNDSPRSLMSSLQVSVRSNDVAMEEIRRDRKAAIESGQLKGRRLFEEEEESEAEVGFGETEELSSVTSYGNGYEGKGTDRGRSEEEKLCCHSGLRLSSSCDEIREDGGGEMVVEVNVVDKVKRDAIIFVNGGGRWDVVTKGWFSRVLMVFAVGIFFMRCNGGYWFEDEVMQVPT